jgi:uncharacterized protein YuzE
MIRRTGRWTYDPAAHALYLYTAGPIKNGGVARTAIMDGAMVHADLDDQGRVIGLEIIGPWPQDAALPEEERQ